MYSLLNYIGMGSIILMIILILLGVVSYFLSSISLMKLAQRDGIEEAWLAWIPIGNLYIIGKLIKTIEFGGNSYEKAELILPGGLLAGMVLAKMPLIGSLANIAIGVLTLYGLFLLYKRYAPEKVMKYMIISILVPGIGSSLALYRIKDCDPV